MSVVGARPQFVKLAPIAHACAQAGVEHVVVHTGQHYDPMLSDVFFSDLNIPTPDEHLGVGSGSHGVQTGAILAALDKVIERHQPDWVLAYGDTNSTIAAALSAVKLHVPIAHLEAGLRSFNRQMPEEINRILTDHASDLLLAPTEVAAQHLAQEGLAERTVVVGDVMTDVLLLTRASVENKPNPVTEAMGWEPGSYSLATIHRPANTDTALQLEAVLDSLSRVDHPVLLLAHPRLMAACKKHGLELDRANLHFHSPLSYPDLIAAALGARGVITDSGGLQKEAFLLRVPCTTVRPQTEWVETVETGWNVLVDAGDGLVAAASRERPAPTDAQPYGDGHAARKVIEVLLQAGASKA